VLWKIISKKVSRNLRAEVLRRVDLSNFRRIEKKSMNGKFSMKLLGTLVALAMLATLVVGITASPASAAAGTLAWGTYSTPSNAGFLLGGNGIGNPTISMVAASPTGSEIFGLDATNGVLYSSTNSGASWSEVAVTGIVNPIAFVVSKNFKTDNAMAIATATGVWISTNAGSSFTAISPTLVNGGVTQVITSMAIGYWFNTGNVLTVLVGLRDSVGTTAGYYASNVISYTYGAFGWTAVPNATTAVAGEGAAANPVYGVAFSPDAVTDGEIMAVYYNSVGGLWISSDFGSLGWDNSAYPDNAVVTTVATNLVNVQIATASDYVANTGASIFVGTNGAATDDVYRVSGRANGAGSSVAEGLDKSVTSLAVSGPIATATVLAGYVGGLSFTTTATASPPTWSVSSGFGTATGDPGSVSVAVAGSMVVAGTQGPDGGIYASSNLGTSFQGVGALNTGFAAVLDVSLVSFNAASPTTWFVTMKNTNSDEEYVFVTTNGGTSWMRIYAESATLQVAVSKAYATDSTVVISDGTALLRESNNGGITFSNVGSAASTISSIFVINASNIFAGTTGGTYKVGSFAQGTTNSTAVTSFALSPTDKTMATFLVGQADGSVWQTTNDGTSFTELASGPVTSTNLNTLVAYGPDGTIYAAVGTGVYSWSPEAAAWTNLGATLTNAVGIAVSTNGILYVADGGTPTTTFVQRSLNPNQENTAAGGAPTFCSMAFGGNSDGTLSSLAVLSATTGNTVVVMDTSAPAASNGVAGCMEGFVDTLSVAPTKLVPANNAIVSFPGSTPSITLSWAAVPGATAYQVTLNGTVLETTPATAVTGTSLTVTNLAPSSVNTWSVNAYGVATSAWVRCSLVLRQQQTLSL